MKLPHDIKFGNKIYNVASKTLRDLESDISYEKSVEKSIIKLKDNYDILNKASIFIIFSMNCNMNCYYCFQKDLVEDCVKYDLNKEDMLKYIKQILKRYEEVEIVLFGGEPLLIENYTIIKWLFNHICALQVKIRIITNGININKYEELMLSYKSIISEIHVTIDGPKEYQDRVRTYKNNKSGHDIVVNNIKNLNLPIVIRTNLCSENIDIQGNLINEILEMRKGLETRFVYCRMSGSQGDLLRELSINDFIKAYRKIEAKYKNLVDINIGDEMIRVLHHHLYNTELTYPRFRYCNKDYAYCISKNGLQKGCVERFGVNNSDLINGSITTISKDAYNKYNVKSCKDCSVNIICGGGCDIIGNNILYCPKSGILEVIENVKIHSLF